MIFKVLWDIIKYSLLIAYNLRCILHSCRFTGKIHHKMLHVFWSIVSFQIQHLLWLNSFFFMYKILFIIIILKLKVLFLKSVQCPILKKKIHNGAVHYLQVERESTSQLSDELEYFQTGLLPNYLFGNYVYVHIKSRTPSCIYCLLSFWNRTDIYCIHSWFILTGN